MKKFSLLTPLELDKDLALVIEYRINHVTIYSLGGLDQEFVKVLRKYVST
ncbi:hypothetical protein GF319_11930 [Candidatus Bathyarchaeota archaeon]|nr:hypothetical protein [Candidatus Bathyarchaeota archaeon]